MFRPPRCPNRHCPRHVEPKANFFVRRGYYYPRCRSHPVPRFRCRTCHRGFSRQTFRADYRDHRPHLNPHVFRSLATGLGLRQTARNTGLSLRCCELKFRKIARHIRRLNLNLRSQLSDGCQLQFDEIESYEGRRNTRPVSIPLLIEKKSRYVIWAESAPIRPHGRMSQARRIAIQADEARFGRRKDLSKRSIVRTLARGEELVSQMRWVPLFTDEKPLYRSLAARAFGSRRLKHFRTNSRLARTTRNPLFPINHTEAMIRDSVGRMRRDSWLATKRRRYLDLGLQVWMAYRNLVRRRFNRDTASPAECLGFVHRRMTDRELISWRQDWGDLSIHPLSRGGCCVRLGRGSAQGAPAEQSGLHRPGTHPQEARQGVHPASVN